MQTELLFKEECYTVVGLCMKVHTKLGRGFKEIVYKDALEVELKKVGITYEREKTFSILYDEVLLPHKFNADFLVFNNIVLEIKAAILTHSDGLYQTLNYLKALNIKLGILINFGTPRLEYHRIICTY
ncbi:MAG: GxxExxY protein [Chitinophagaceae bacterium]